jgi:hypothetical protein
VFNLNPEAWGWIFGFAVVWVVPLTVIGWPIVGGMRRSRYERRYAVHRATRSLIDQSHQRYIPSETLNETLNALVMAQRDTAFLFDDEVDAYLTEISHHATSLQSITLMMEGMPVGDQKADAAGAAGKHRQWLLARDDAILAEKFRRYLKFA